MFNPLSHSPTRASLAFMLSLWLCVLGCHQTTASDDKEGAKKPTVAAGTAAQQELRAKLEKEACERQALYERLKRLFAEGAVSRQKVDEAKAEWERVQQQLATLTTPKDQPAPAVDPMQLLASQVQKSVAEIEQQRQQLKALMSAISPARGDITSAAEVLDQMISQSEGTPQKVHPLIRAARDYLNAPYAFGGTNADGVDCSGLVYRLLSDLGVKAPRTAEALFAFAAEVALNDMQPGDLVFFADTYKPGLSHVGILLSADRFLHASGKGKGVIISSLRDAYYLEHFAGIRRVKVPDNR